MTVHLQTERLTLRHFTPDDLDELVALHNDPAVMRYLSREPTSPEVVRDRVLPRLLAHHERADGFGLWPAIERATGAFLGWFLFRREDADPAPGEVELGYRLHTAAWGRGIATEGSIALVEKGFTEQGVRRVVATTMAVNQGSRRVMEKVGLRYVRTFHEEYDVPLPGSEHGEVEYALTREEWAARRP